MLYHATEGHKTIGNWYTTLLNAQGNPIKHYGDLDLEMSRKKPQWMTLSCGVNDVWHFKLRLGKRTFKGVGLEEYKRTSPQSSTRLRRPISKSWY